MHRPEVTSHKQFIENIYAGCVLGNCVLIIKVNFGTCRGTAKHTNERNNNLSPFSVTLYSLIHKLC